MTVRQRPQWTAVEVAAHAMQATSLSELTLPEVKRMAARILDDERNAPEPSGTDPKLETRAGKLIAASRDEFDKGWSDAVRRLE